MTSDEIEYGLKHYGDDPNVERAIIETIHRLPEQVQAFALEQCLFVSVGRRVHGSTDLVTFPPSREEQRVWLVALPALTPDSDIQSEIAHEIAHAFLGHDRTAGAPAEEDEDEATAQAHTWGFIGAGAERPTLK